MARKIIRFEPGARHAERTKEDTKPVIPRPPEPDEPDAVEHPALKTGKKNGPKLSKSLYKIAAVLLAAALLLVVLENWEDLTFGNIGNWFRTKAVGLGFGDGYPVDLIGSTADPGNFGSEDGNMYVVSDTALTVLNSSAKEMFSVRHSFNNPAVSVSGGRYLMYNVGATGYRVDTAAGTEVLDSAECSITAGAVCSTGKFALATQPSDYASELSVYMKDGSLQYQYKFADSYISAVTLNVNGTKGAVASICSRDGDIVSRITVFDFSKEEPIAVYESEGNLVYGLLWSANNRVLAIGDTQTLVSDARFNFDVYDYGGREVTAFCTTKDKAIVSVSNYAYGGSSTLLIFSNNAEPVEAELPGRAVWLSCAGSKVGALLSESVVTADLFTGVLEASCEISPDTKSMAMADEGTLYLLGVREIRKENLKIIRNPEELFQSE